MHIMYSNHRFVREIEEGEVSRSSCVQSSHEGGLEGDYVMMFEKEAKHYAVTSKIEGGVDAGESRGSIRSAFQQRVGLWWSVREAFG